MNLTELKQKPASELVTLSSELGLDNLARNRKQDVIFEILKAQAKKGGRYLWRWRIGNSSGWVWVFTFGG